MRIAPQDRYEVRPVGAGYAIKDLALGAYCGLGRGALAWDTRREAQDWLQHCYDVWGMSPALGEAPPKRVYWNMQPKPFRERSARSPWEGWTTPLYP